MCGGDFYGSLKPEGHATCFERLQNNLSEFAAAMVGPFYSGEEFGIIDAIVFPFLYRAFALNLFQYHRQHDIHSETYSPKIVNWVKRCLQLEAVKRTLPEDVNQETGFSQSLFDVYHTYAAGVGLKGILVKDYNRLII